MRWNPERQRRSSWRAIVVALCVSFSVAGCAAVQTPGRQVRTIDDVRALERSIEELRGVTGSIGECVDRCRAAESICDSSEMICQIASDLAELEAIESCRRAEEHCNEARRNVVETCTCS